MSPLAYFEPSTTVVHLLSLQSKDCMLFAGTAVANGACLGVVNDIGMDTEIGKIQTQIHEAAGEEDDTPLKKKLDDFGNRLAQVKLYWVLAGWGLPDLSRGLRTVQPPSRGLISCRLCPGFKVTGGSRWLQEPVPGA